MKGNIQLVRWHCRGAVKAREQSLSYGK
jgi:hypothetical protein